MVLLYGPASVLILDLVRGFCHFRPTSALYFQLSNLQISAESHMTTKSCASFLILKVPKRGFELGAARWKSTSLPFEPFVLF